LKKDETSSTAGLLAVFRAQALEADEQSVLNARRSNAAGRRLWQICHELRRRGSYRDEILSLLEDANPSVRVWAARLYLEFAPEKALPVLEAEAGLVGVAAARATGTLMLWRRGELPFP
jgi:hypothetical protein